MIDLMMTIQSNTQHRTRTPITAQAQRAFTLAEMAIVVVLMGIVLTMGLKMSVASLSNSAYAETTAKQAQIKLALIAYLRTNGTLPCPDTALGAPTGNQIAPCSASAAASYGVVPWLTLQLPRDVAQDGWGNFFTYKVANGVGMRNWTIKTVAATTFDMGQLGPPVSANALTIKQGDGLIAPATITTKAVVVILSGGKNGFGTKTVLGSKNSAPTFADELTNATNTTTTFIVRPYTEKIAAFNGPFDDRVMYLLPQDLLQPLITEQTVTACKMYCPVCTGAGAPSPYCTGAGLPNSAANATSCTAAGKPYLTCASAATPICTVTTASPIPIGNPTPACP